jgi:prevent-host-death family protein
MSTVGVRELKNRLTDYLRRTKLGEEVIVTEHGKPIALIHPFHPSRKGESLEARLAGLASQGFISPPSGKRLKKFRPFKVSGTPLSQMALQDRR